MLRKVAATLFFLQGALPLFFCMSWTPLYRLLAVLAFVVYGVLALEMWIGHRLAILLALGISALQSFGFSTATLSWRFMLGPAIEATLVPVVGSIADWRIGMFRSFGLGLDYSLGRPCPAIQQAFGIQDHVFWLNLVGALICILLLIAYERGRTLPVPRTADKRI
jgi:hypothetical protein